MLVHKLGYHRRSIRLSCLDSHTHTSLCAADDTPADALVNLRNGITGIHIDLETVIETVCGRDAAVELIRTYLQRVSITVCGATPVAQNVSGYQTTCSQ